MCIDIHIDRYRYIDIDIITFLGLKHLILIANNVDDLKDFEDETPFLMS